MPQLSPPVTILSVEGRNVNTSRGPGIAYDIKASDGNKYGTFNGALAQQASAAQTAGATVVLSHEVNVRNGYTNFDLKEILASNGAVSTQAAAPVAAPPIPVAPASVVSPDAKDAKITRLAAHKTAATLIAGLYAGGGSVADVIGDFRRLTEELIRHAQTGEWSGITIAEPEPVPAQAGTSQTSQIDW